MVLIDHWFPEPSPRLDSLIGEVKCPPDLEKEFYLLRSQGADLERMSEDFKKTDVRKTFLKLNILFNNLVGSWNSCFLFRQKIEEASER